MAVNDGSESDVRPSMTPSTVLSVAGSDSGGNAGLAADLKTFAAHGVHGVFAVTLVTAQDTTGIAAAVPMTADLIASQIDAVTSDFAVAATKTGLLFTVGAIDVVASRASELGPLVIDPVLVSSSGAPLLDGAVQEAYVQLLFPVAEVITPNVFEASLLTGIRIERRDDAVRAATELLELGPKAVLVTGLHDGAHAVDVFASSAGTVPLEHDLIATSNVLGTGCSLSASIAARLALGDDLSAAVVAARRYVLDGLRGSKDWRLGAGQGPIDHFAHWPELR